MTDCSIVPVFFAVVASIGLLAFVSAIAAVAVGAWLSVIDEWRNG